MDVVLRHHRIRAGPRYAERKAAREAEIEGLKEALTILEG